jgi:hypothetical protein
MTVADRSITAWDGRAECAVKESQREELHQAGDGSETHGEEAKEGKVSK